MKAELKLEVSSDLKLQLTTSRLSRGTRTPTRLFTPSVHPSPPCELPHRPATDFLMNLSFDNTKPRAPTSSSRRLVERIAELERQRKADHGRITELEDKVKALELELERLRSMSKQVLEEHEGADLHALYHELFLTDLKKQVDSVNREASAYRTHYEEHRKELDTLRRECYQQKALLRRYREFLAETHSRQSVRPHVPDSNSQISGASSDPVEELRREADGHFLAPPKLTSLTVKFARLQTLAEVLILLAHARDFTSLCGALSQAAKTLVQCSTVRVYLIDPVCVTLYSKGRSQLYRFIVDKATVTLHQEREEPQSPLFTRLEDARQGIRNHDLLVQPVELGPRLLLVVQCTEKIEGKRRRGFVQADEVLLRVLCRFASLHVQMAESREREQLHDAHVGRITQLCTRLFAARTHQRFANRLRELLPAFMEFEYAGVVFFDGHANEFFTLMPEAGRGSAFSSEAIRFPVTVGLTGEVFNSKQTLVMDSAAKSQRYNPEIDNAASAPDVRNLLLGCLITEEGQCVGVVQLANKVNRGKVLPEDRSKLEGVLSLLAGIIANCNEVLICLEITTGVRQCMARVSATASEAEDLRSHLDSSVLLSQISTMRSLLADWSKKRA